MFNTLRSFVHPDTFAHPNIPRFARKVQPISHARLAPRTRRTQRPPRGHGICELLNVGEPDGRGLSRLHFCARAWECLDERKVSGVNERSVLNIYIIFYLFIWLLPCIIYYIPRTHTTPSTTHGAPRHGAANTYT